MKERPIPFSGEMVRAILDGRKTQTRRIVRKPKSLLDYDVYPHRAAGRFWWFDANGFSTGKKAHCPYGVPGDRLWVRETWCTWVDMDAYALAGEPIPIHYRAAPLPDGYENERHFLDHTGALRWRPSIHMPRWASRITLEVTRVRVERLNDMVLSDVYAEGLPHSVWPTECQCAWFRKLWDSINAKRGYSWDSNPWVWVVEFMQSNEKGERE